MQTCWKVRSYDLCHNQVPKGKFYVEFKIFNQFGTSRTPVLASLFPSELSFLVAIPKAPRRRRHVVRIKGTVDTWKLFIEMRESRGIAMFAKDILN